MPVILAPDEVGGEDWATAHTGRAWDFTHPSDAAALGNVQQVAWTGSELAASNRPPVQNDPHVVLRQPAAIDPARYHRLTVRMRYDGPFNLADAAGGGTHGRLLWRRADRGDAWQDSHEIVTYRHVHSYTVSLQTNPSDAVAESGPGWTGSPVTAVRWDPNEDRGPRRWYLSEVSLRADHETAGGVFDVRWVDRGHSPGSTVTIARHGGGPGAPATTIASGVSQGAGENVYRWDTAGVPHGRHWISVTVDDGRTSTATVSSGPVRVHAGGTPPPPPLPDTSAACADGQVPPTGFVDVATGSVHRAAIDCMVWWDVARGVAADRYTPDRSVTRAQMATFLVRAYEHAAGERLGATRTWFTDIAGSPHEHAINAAAEAGFASGTAPGAYSPHHPVRRDQMASFLARPSIGWSKAATPAPPPDLSPRSRGPAPQRKQTYQPRTTSRCTWGP